MIENEVHFIPFSFPTVPGPVNVVVFPSFFKILFTWDCPEMPNGLIIAYEVEHWPTAEPQSVTTVNTTDLATNYTVSGLEVGTEIKFSVRAYTRVGPGDSSSETISSLTRPRK